MTTLFVLDVADYRPLAEAAAKDTAITVRRRGPYFEIVTGGPIEIDRSATGCRNAVWYSAVAAVDGGRLAVWGATLLRIEPDDSTGGR
jgi:hypothetical protein